MKWTLILTFFVLNLWTVQSHSRDLEKTLLDTYDVLESPAFESRCLALAAKLDLAEVKSCKLLNTDNINAFAMQSGTIYFTKGMMSLFNNAQQWSFVLAHENAHLVLNHLEKRVKKLKKPGVFFTKTRVKKLLKKQEKEADEWASDWLKRFDVDEQQLSYFLSRAEKSLKNRQSKYHLKLKNRTPKANSKEIVDCEFKAEIQSFFAAGLMYN